MFPRVVLFLARLSLDAGDVQRAVGLLETLDVEENVAARSFQARLLLAQGKHHEAALLLERLASAVQEWQPTIETQILLALAYASCGENRLATQRLRQALSLAHDAGLVSLFLFEGKPLVLLLRQIAPTLHEPGLHAYAQTILRAFTQPGEPSVASLIEPLSSQEQRILRLIAAGRSNPEIAQELIISINTVKDHVKHLYYKLGVRNRVQACEVARQLKLI